MELAKELIQRRHLFTVSVFVDLQDYQLCDQAPVYLRCPATPLGSSLHLSSFFLFLEESNAQKILPDIFTTNCTIYFDIKSTFIDIAYTS